MAKNSFDSKLERMSYLMNYDNRINESCKKKNNNIEYHTTGADGKIYGILKENDKYVIKTTNPGNELISENYNYINGYNYRNENSYTSYNDATKQLELKLMSLNEAYGKHNNVSTINFNKSKESLKTLTEEARKELNRMQQILENSQNIGKTVISDPEGETKAECPSCQGEPFDEKIDAKPEKEHTFKCTVDSANDFKKVTDVESDLTSIENKKIKDNELSKFKKVSLKEETEDDEDEFELVGFDLNDNDEVSLEDILNDDDENINDEEIEDLLKKLNESDNIIYGDDKVLCGPHGKLDVQTVNKGALCNDKLITKSKMDSIEALDGPHGKLDVQTVAEGKSCKFDKDITKDGGRVISKQQKGNKANWKKQIESELEDDDFENVSYAERRQLAEGLCKEFGIKNFNKVFSMVNEEAEQLFGKHPKFGVEPFTTPSNDKKCYGKEIKKGKPFEELVDKVTTIVIQQLQESNCFKKKTLTKGKHC